MKTPFAITLLSILLLAGPVLGQNIQVNRDNRTIAVTSTDDAEVTADTAVVTVGFTLYGTDQNQTYADASRISNAVIDALHASGVKQDAIQSTQQSLTEIDDEDKVRYSKGIRFRFSQAWSVTGPASSASEILQVAITAGANNSGGIQWKLSNEETLEAMAAEKALAHAQKIAERYALGLKSKLGALVYASNQEPVRGFFGRSLNTSTASMSSSKINLKPLAIVPEKISKSITVYAVFAIE